METGSWSAVSGGSPKSKSCGASLSTTEGRDPPTALRGEGEALKERSMRMKPSEWTQSTMLPTACPGVRETRLEPELSLPSPCFELQD